MIDHINRFKKIKKYVNFNYDLRSVNNNNLSDYDKRKIKKYYDELKELLSKPNYVYRPRNKKRLKAARDFADMSNLQGFKPIVILKNDNQDKKPKIKFDKNNKMTVETDFVTTHDYDFNKTRLINDTAAEVDRALKSMPKNAKSFTLKVGKHETKQYYGAEDLLEETNRFLSQYADKKVTSWFNGIYGYSYNNQKAFIPFANKKKAGRDEYRKQSAQAFRDKKELIRISDKLSVATDAEIRNKLRRRQILLTNRNKNRL